VPFRGHSRTLGQAAALLHQHDIENLDKGDEKREAARSDADERRLTLASRGIGEDSEDAEGKTEERRRRASDHAEWGGHGKQSPCPHANRLPETREVEPPAQGSFRNTGPGERENRAQD